MKNVKTLCIALMTLAMFVCESASAQYYTRPSGSSSSSYSFRESKRNWNMVDISLGLSHLGYKLPGEDKSDSEGLQTLTYSYMHGIGLGASSPFFVELGAGMEYTWDDGGFGTLHNLAFTIPVNISYEIPASDNIDIIPLTGLYVRLNQTGDLDNDDKYISGSIYKGSEVTDEYTKFNRVQVGWQLGARARFNQKFHAGLAFKLDLTNWNGDIDAKLWNLAFNFGLDF